ncbi:MAG TPA: periplasmic heavy metal sensor [Albitalea sp.]
MKRLLAYGLLGLPLLALALPAAAQHSTYAGQEAREIKALSPEDVGAYLAGKGMGLAKAAELNGYPGPAHVLELASKLELTAEQRTKTQSLFASMEAKAMSLGRALIDEERKLDRLFASKAIDPDSLNRTLDAIGQLQAKVRGAHLEAHLAQVKILTPQQTQRYAALRGYAAAGGNQGHGEQHKH